MEDRYLKASSFIYDQYDELSEAIVERQYALEPEIWEKYGEVGRKKSVRDVKYHLSYIAEALASSNPPLFIDYIAWVKVLFTQLKFPEGVILTTLRCIRDVLQEELPKDLSTVGTEYVEEGIRQFPQLPSVLPSFIKKDAPLYELARGYMDALLKGERHTASQLISRSVEDGVNIKDIYLYVFQNSLREIGRLWQTNRISVAQEHYFTAATQLIISQLYPYIFSTDKNGYRLVATCVGEELHEVGVRMVTDFFEMEGWDTYYLGANTPKESILQTIKEQKFDILGISATMTFHIGTVRDLISHVRNTEAGKRLKIMVGGYPFNVAPNLWKQIGADSYARDAEEALLIAKNLINGESFR
jgi:methanogenic corrinoid protein MtbC1